MGSEMNVLRLNKSNGKLRGAVKIKKSVKLRLLAEHSEQAVGRSSTRTARQYSSTSKVGVNLE